jgi:hypothetical protein
VQLNLREGYMQISAESTLNCWHTATFVQTYSIGCMFGLSSLLFSRNPSRDSASMTVRTRPEGQTALVAELENRL